LFAGLGLSWSYLDSFHALYGTTYGLMVLTKVVAFGLLLGIGGLNYFIVRRVQTDPIGLLRRLSRFAEAEVGIGFTIILATASLTSMPPAVDLRDSRATVGDIVQRFSPRLPKLKSPNMEELTLASPLDMDANGAAGLAPESFVPGQVKQANTASDIAWSEYNHNWSGLVVLTAGLLAVAARTNRIRLARHWPLVFIGLAVFLFLRADPENWPLGPHGFWESMVVAEVLQHRLFVFLIVSFAIFEWKVQTGRISPARAGLVFPAVCAIGGALLLTHTHSLGNSREQLLIEMSHVPLALLGVAAGWSRWLELRSTSPYARVFSWIWPICLTLVGAILVNYREV
jgi:putative copper resistance protein D